MQGGLGQDIAWMRKVFPFTFWPFLYCFIPLFASTNILELRVISSLQEN